MLEAGSCCGMGSVVLHQFVQPFNPRKSVLPAACWGYGMNGLQMAIFSMARISSLRESIAEGKLPCLWPSAGHNQTLPALAWPVAS